MKNFYLAMIKCLLKIKEIPKNIQSVVLQNEIIQIEV
jgi:hypothetical protein